MEMLMPAFEFDAKRDMTVMIMQGRWAAKLKVAFKPALLAVGGLQDSIPACLLFSASLAKVPGCDLRDC